MADLNSVGTNTYAASVSAANQFGANMNIPEMIMALQLERSNILDSQIKDQMGDMQKRNEWLKDANAALAELRKNRPTSESGSWGNYGSFTKSDGSTANTHKWMDDNGIAIENTANDDTGQQGEFDAAINNLKSSIDTVNSQSQMDMVRLQGLMDKRNQAFDMMTNTLSKTAKSMDGIIGNMR